MNQSIGIVVPAYNEAPNIGILAKRIFTILPAATLVIVDDSPPKEQEETKRVVSRLPPEIQKQITVITRKGKLGRGSAVLVGIRELLKDTKITAMFEMDADLAHDPREFPKFFDAVKKTHADVVIGSRYLGKSQIVRWPIQRRIASRMINTMINILLGLRLSDYTNGFRLYNRNAAEFLTRITLKEKGFISLSETAFRLQQQGFRLREVPITFTDRIYGTSSADAREFFSAALGIFRVRFGRFKKEMS